MFDPDIVCGLAAAGLERAARRADRDQSHLGVDARPELELHDLLAGALAGDDAGEHGFAVFREERYPSDRTRRKRSEGLRCDLVLTDDPAAQHHALLDPLAGDTLFADHGVPPEHALWLEVKAVGQHAVIEGLGRPNPGYAAELLTGVTGDVRKLRNDPAIRHAAVLLLLFTEDAPTAHHDLRVWHERCLARNLPVGAPVTRGFPIPDRIGNARATVALAPVWT